MSVLDSMLPPPATTNRLAPKAKPVRREVVYEKTTAKSPPDVPPVPCLQCGAPAVWRDRFGGCHCPCCDPAPSRAAVESCWDIYVTDEGRMWIETHFNPVQKA